MPAPAAPLALLASAPGVSIVPAIGIAIVAAAVLAVLFQRVRQPALLAYIAAGLVLGFFAEYFAEAVPVMEDVAHLGLVLLLFIIGMEMDLRGVLRLGPRAAVAILLQAPVSIIIVLGLQALLAKLGWQVPGLGDAPATWVYFAVAASLGSTAVVIKLLADKFDLDTQAGRVTVLTLIGQDVWAVLALSYVAAQGEGTVGRGGVLLMLLGAVALTVACLALGAVLLSRVLARIATSPDLIAVVALGWCFLWSEGFHEVGVSAEMGALVAGLAIGRLPQRTEILARVISLRDFFMALFFVALGMSLPAPSAAVLGGAAVLTAVVIASRLLLFAPMLLASGLGPIVSYASAVNIAQVSEFSLLLVPIGVAQGALTAAQGTTIAYALMLSVVLSTYAIPANYRIAGSLAHWTGRKPAPARPAAVAHRGHGPAPEIVLLGYFHNADALAHALARVSPELLPKVLVIDYNLKNHDRIRQQGMNVAYGDISNPETLRHHGVGEARVVVSTISDTFLRGITNAMLLDQVLAINPAAHFIATAATAKDAGDLLRRGAFISVVPPIEAADTYAAAIRAALLQIDRDKARDDRARPVE